MTPFETAFNKTMTFEVGAWWNPLDPDVMAGKCDTVVQKMRVGYVNDPRDRGGETKYGIAMRANAGINIRGLTLTDARAIYEQKYWYPGGCDRLPGEYGVLHFDACVNHGIKKAVQLLQRAVGADDDGVFGPGTLAAFNKLLPVMTKPRFLAPRRQFFLDIVTNNPTQKAFLDGWLNRVKALET